MKNNSSGTTGVYFNKKSNKWHAKIMNCKKAIFIGSFKTELEAINARIDAEIKYIFHVNHGK